MLHKAVTSPRYIEVFSYYYKKNAWLSYTSHNKSCVIKLRANLGWKVCTNTTLKLQVGAHGYFVLCILSLPTILFVDLVKVQPRRSVVCNTNIILSSVKSLAWASMHGKMQKQHLGACGV